MTSLFRPARLSPAAWGLAGLAALAVGVGGYFHGHLWHEGYAQVDVVGPLFLINVIASAAVIGLLVLRRVLAFLLGALAISVGSLVSILISHSTSFFGFAEHRFDTRATVIVVAEIAAIVLCLVLGAVARHELFAPGGDRTVQDLSEGPNRSASTRSPAPWESGLLALVTVITVLVIIGVGQGAPPHKLAISPRASQRELQVLASAGSEVHRGESLFSGHGCNACHTLAAGDYGGRIGPRLDVQSQGDKVSDVLTNIIDPPDDDKGYEHGLMPENYAKRLSRGDLTALAVYIHAAASAAAGPGGGS